MYCSCCATSRKRRSVANAVMRPWSSSRVVYASSSSSSSCCEALLDSRGTAGFDRGRELKGEEELLRSSGFFVLGFVMRDVWAAVKCSGITTMMNDLQVRTASSQSYHCACTILKESQHRRRLTHDHVKMTTRDQLRRDLTFSPFASY